MKNLMTPLKEAWGQAYNITPMVEKKPPIKHIKNGNTPRNKKNTFCGNKPTVKSIAFLKSCLNFNS